MLLVAKADTAGWNGQQVAKGFIRTAPPGRQERIYYHVPRWPWALVVTQGTTLDHINGRVCVIGYNALYRPGWMFQTKSKLNSFDPASQELPGFAKDGPEHWKFGYYKIVIFEAKESTAILTASEVMDAAQAFALGPFISALASGVMPPGVDVARLQELLVDDVKTVAWNIEALLDRFAALPVA